MHRWLQIGSAAAFTGAATVLAGAAFGGITEPTGVAAVAAVVSTVVAYGVAPLVLAVALQRTALSEWFGVVTALLAAAVWSAVALFFALPTLYAEAPTLIDAFVSIAPPASALWIVVASAEVVRAGLHRWSLVIIGVFIALLIVGSVLIELSGFDIRRVLVPLGWAAWMVDIGRALGVRMSPPSEQTPLAASRAPCANCGAPRRKDGLAFCSSCGLPYGVERP